MSDETNNLQPNTLADIDQQTTNVYSQDDGDAHDLGIAGLENYAQIGRGGFATVYSADDRALGRKVAVKVLRHLDDDGVRRFRREAQILANLGSHENLAIIHRFDQTASGNPCFIMEFVAGGTLADKVSRGGTIEPKVAITYARQVARALMHTHNRGIVHRDIKPSNVLLTADGQAKLSDFGIAVIRSSSATLNAATFEHAAPEVFLGRPSNNDERIDLYSLASTLFNLIDGSAPYHVPGESSHEALLNRVLNAPVPVTTQAPQLDGFWPKALAKDPDQRFQTAAEMLTALTALGRDTPTPPGSAPQRAPVSPPDPAPQSPPPPPSVDGPNNLPPPPGNGAQPSARPTPPPPNSPPPPVAKTTIAVGGRDNDKPLSPQEMAVVDSYATSSSVEQRRNVAGLTTTQSVLFNLAQDHDDTVATTAIGRLTDQTMLGRLLEPVRPKRTRVLAAGQITSGPLALQLADDPDADVRTALAVGVTDPAVIGRLIKDPTEQVRSAVISKINNPDVLLLIAQSPEVETRRAIAHHVKSTELRTKLAQDSDATVRQAALAGLDLRSVLDLATSDDEAISRSALEFITDTDSLEHLSRHATLHVQTGAIDRLAATEAGLVTLARIAAEVDHPQWEGALDRITDQQTLAQLTRTAGARAAESALARLSDETVLAELARDPTHRFRVQATARITDPILLEPLSHDSDNEVASLATGTLARLRHHKEKMATARIVAAALIIFALVITLIWNSLWFLAFVFVAAVVGGYRLYARRSD